MTAPRELPPGWRWARFSDVASVASDLVDPALYPSLPHIAPNHIESQTGRLLPFRTVSEDGVTSSNHRFRAGQVLYSKIRPYLAKVALAPFEGLCSADMYPLDTTLSAGYLKWWLLTPEFTGLAAGQQARTVLPKINKRSLTQLPVPVPPMEEQRRIFDILEDHLSRLDAAESYARKSVLRTKSLVRSVLIDAMPERGCDDWRLTTVDNAGLVDLGRQRHPDWHTGPEMHPYLRVANIFEDRIDTTDVMQMDFSGCFDRFRLGTGDVLLNEGQSPHLLGRPAIYRGEPPDVAFTNSLLRFRANDDVLPEWALLVFRRHMHAGRFTRESRITTNIAHLSAKRFKTVEFPIPTLDEQRRLVDLITERLAAVSRLASNAETALRRSRVLRSALLQAAFSGQLTGRVSDLDRAEESIA
jgi:type I restriction enzyme S subunit